MPGRSSVLSPQIEEEKKVRSLVHHSGPTHRAFNLQVRFTDEKGKKRSQGFAWAWYQFNDLEVVEGTETLTLLFTHRAIIIRGTWLDLILRQLEEEDMTLLQQLTPTEADQQEDLNQNGEVDERMPVIRAVEIIPPFEQFIDNLRSIPDGD